MRAGPRPNDVGVGNAVKRVESQRGLAPDDAVGTFRVAGNLGPFRPGTPVIHPEPIPVPHHRRIRTPRPFPRFVEHDRPLARHGPVQGQTYAVHAIDEPIIDKEFEAGPDVSDLGKSRVDIHGKQRPA